MHVEHLREHKELGLSVNHGQKQAAILLSSRFGETPQGRRANIEGNANYFFAAFFFFDFFFIAMIGHPFACCCP